jgi:hypothetical protein
MLEIQVDHHNTIVVDLYHNSFVEKWCDLFTQTVASCNVEQLESFCCTLTDEEAQLKIVNAANVINNFLKTDFINQPFPGCWQDQNWYNYLHDKFEQLSGTYEKPTKLLLIAPQHVKQAVRHLNLFLHTLEKSLQGKKFPWYISFNKDCYQRKPFSKEDYNYIKFEFEPGEVYIHYAELGKTYYDLFNDQLPIDYSGLKNLHYYSAELSVSFNKQTIPCYPEEFYHWAKKHKIDVRSKQSGLGILPVGKLRNIDQARQIVYNGNEITNLRINHGKTI